MLNIFCIIGLLWVAWLLYDGLSTAEIWVKGGAKDRLTRSLDMQSFAHKVARSDSSIIYWIHVVFYTLAIIFFLYMLFIK